MENIIPYKGQNYHTIKLFGLTRKLPIVNVGDGIWIASNAEIILGDIEFISRAAEAIKERISGLSPDAIVAPEAKSIGLAYEVARQLGHKRIIVARKSIKAYMKNFVLEHLKSITTSEEQRLVLSDKDIDYLQGKKVCILDDVVSTGGTIEALEKLVLKAEPKKLYKVVIWREGSWYKSEGLIYLDTLPVYIE
jgi:adenine phosphoribosyltransferase